MDWSFLRAKYRDEKLCNECKEQKPVGAFTPGRWKRTDEARVCRECMQRHADALQPWQCMACKAWKEESSFAENYRRPQCTFYRVCQTCEEAKVCDGCRSRKARDMFSTAMWQRKRAGVRYCLCCARKAHGLWTCSGCGVKKSLKEFEGRGVQNDKQHCADCRKPCVAKAIIVKAVAWLAPRQAKVAQKAANEKKERIIAEVWEEIRRKRGMAVSQPPNESEAKRRKCNVTAVLSQESVNPPVLLKSKEAQVEAGTNDKQNLPRAEVPRESGKREADQKRKREKDGPQQANAARKGFAEKQADPELFRYVCPFCHGVVTSRVRTGPVNHRRVCGKQFRVRDGCVASKKAFVYGCPFCGGNVESNLKTGRINHRTVCGNHFYVHEGVVTVQTRQHRTASQRAGR